jgi:hypothetical protein
MGGGWHGGGGMGGGGWHGGGGSWHGGGGWAGGSHGGNFHGGHFHNGFHGGCWGCFGFGLGFAAAYPWYYWGDPYWGYGASYGYPYDGYYGYPDGYGGGGGYYGGYDDGYGPPGNSAPPACGQWVWRPDLNRYVWDNANCGPAAEAGPPPAPAPQRAFPTPAPRG